MHQGLLGKFLEEHELKTAFLASVRKHSSNHIENVSRKQQNMHTRLQEKPLSGNETFVSLAIHILC